MQLTVPKIVAQMAEVLRTRGHHQTGGYMPNDGDPNSCPVCVLGALNVVLGGDPRAAWSHDFGVKSQEVIGALTRRVGSIVDWSDRTPTESVLAVLDLVAAEEAHGP